MENEDSEEVEQGADENMDIPHNNVNVKISTNDDVEIDDATDQGFE